MKYQEGFLFTSICQTFAFVRAAPLLTSETTHHRADAPLTPYIPFPLCLLLEFFSSSFRHPAGCILIPAPSFVLSSRNSELP